MEVVAAAIIDNGDLLACRRIRPAHLAGRYELPGGKVDAGEDLRVALAREIREELAVEIIVAEYPLGRWQIADGVDLVAFTARLVGVRPNASTDHDDLRWLAREHWRTGVDWIEVDRGAIAALEQHADREQSREGQQ